MEAPIQGRCPASDVNDGGCPEKPDHLRGRLRVQYIKGTTQLNSAIMTSILIESNKPRESVIRTVFSSDFPLNFLKVRDDQRLGVDLSESNEYVPCIHSICINESTNVVKFKANWCEFLVFQHVSSADYVYFFDNDQFIYRCHVSMEIARSSLGRYLEVLADAADAWYGEITLGGLIASHVRPHHFFYDTVLGMQRLYRSGSLIGKQIYQMPGSQFAKFEAIYDDVPGLSSEATDHTRLNQLAREKSLIFFKVGDFWDRRERDESKNMLLAEFDELFIQHAACISTDLLTSLKSLKREGCFLLWHGITTQKRRWLEQEDAIVHLVKQLTATGLKVCLIIDGWTIPHNKTEKDLHQVMNDREACDRISTLIDEQSISASVHSIIGELPSVKIAVAGLIDFHITNGGTGSLYPSRFLRKNGVMHIANQSRKMTEQSIHHCSLFVPHILVKDLPDPHNDRADYVSYSIDIRAFSDLATELALREKSINISVHSVVNAVLASDADTLYIASNDDPGIILRVGNLGECFNYVFGVRVETSLKLVGLKPRLYVDYGRGFNARDVFSGCYDSNGLFMVKFNYRAKIHRFRFDPFECVGDFRINEVFLAPLKYDFLIKGRFLL